MNKQELLYALTNTWQNFVIGLLLTQFMPEEEWISLSQSGIRFDGPNGPWFHGDTNWTANVLGDHQNRVNALSELEKSLKRALLREGHELILLYPICIKIPSWMSDFNRGHLTKGAYGTAKGAEQP